MDPMPEIPPRAADAHKGTFGRVLALAGSTGMVGAAALTGEAALRSGAGLVTIGTPRSVYPILASKVTCCLTRPLPETSDGTLSIEAFGPILVLAANCDVVALGPGLGRDESTTALVHRLVAEIDKPMVVDADALNALAGNVAVLKNCPAPRLLTPHPGEMSRLTGASVGEVQSDRSGRAQRFAREYGVVLLLKGHGTVVSDGERVYVNATGNPGMATAGSGDVLTGLIAALLAQGLDPYDAARLGAHLHGLAGDLAAARLGQISLIATDILNALPKAFQRR
jgi:NAD(P)H-hydrate epimerase